MTSELNICNNCENYLELTEKECDLISSIIYHHSQNEKRLIGLCINKSNYPQYTFIDDLIYKGSPIKNCDLFKQGHAVFKLPYDCPNCGKSTMISINFEKTKGLFCLNCIKFFQVIPIKVACMSCKTNLFLEAEATYSYFCKKCEKKVEIPILPQVYPSLIPSGSKCLHNLEPSNCLKCSLAQFNHSNIIADEIEDAINERIREAEVEQALFYSFEPTRKIVYEYDYDDDAYDEYSCDFDYDIFEDYDNYKEDWWTLLKDDFET